MPSRFDIAVVLCLTTLLLAGCAFLGKPAELQDWRSTQHAGGPRVQSQEDPRLERAAAFRDSGRYYR